MPSAELSADSLVATRTGWCPLRLLGSHPLLVLDRFGTICAASVELEIGPPQPAVYLGTRAAFGPFVSGSRVLDAGGAKLSVAALLREDVRTRNYEATCAAVSRSFESTAVDRLWTALASVAAASEDQLLVLRTLDAAVPLPADMPSVVRAGIRFVVLDREGLRAALAKNWSEVVSVLMRGLFLRPEESRLEVPVEAFELGFWFVAAATARSSNVRFAYDSLQHSSFLFIHESSEPIAGGVPGSTAFVRPLAKPAIRISWSDTAANPIVNGFILAG